MKVTAVPAQIVVLLAAMETLGVLEVFTVIVIQLLTILLLVTHPTLLVNTQVITSLFAKVLLL